MTTATPDSLPRLDYLEIAHRLSADVLKPEDESGATFRWPTWVDPLTRLNPYPPIEVIRRLPHYAIALSMSEKEALPLSALLWLLKRPLTHVLIGHKLSSGSKRRLLRLWPLHQSLSHLVCVCRPQADYATRELGIPESKVSFVYDSVDDRFFRPMGSNTADYVLCVGQERRDYDTMLRAISGTGLKLRIVASGGWTDARFTAGHDAAVDVQRSVSYERLRQLYSEARLVVVPLRNADYAAGVNSVLEAMAMSKPVIVSKTIGIVDYVTHGTNAVCVRPGEVEDLRCAILSLWGDDAEAERLGLNARCTIEERNTLNAYVDRVTRIVLGSVVERSNP